ncbi:hypothetical protein P171DRAFT_433238 [Karstenula rhodostoma CBS 690.94]|uniref:AA1-like domain-containing protein n=1 Tax=Karstenula rhodostoma CBS 690.94 TaxID=1392251 RepID=A0A9P4U8Z4_9PLEO|nr:hypothetical protein P171DRAFT_433238 [Karstenula rhodostoma CBS 690.94]
MHSQALLALAFSVLASASPTLQKRVSASITLFPDKNFGGAGYTIPFNIQGPTCVAATLPSSIDLKASSVRLSSHTGFNCRLVANRDCNIDHVNNATWFFNVDIPDLSTDDYMHMEDRVRSVTCTSV